MLPALLLLLSHAADVTPEAKPRAFAPLARPEVPAASAWAANPVDAFIEAALRKKGLRPSKPASPDVLRRRLAFDLTGLPPEGDVSVDRLLASPAFGERWAQMWLDLVRYADSDGFNQDALRPEAFRYRDWVIRALNADLPYDQFLRLQMAGDEARPGDPDALAATGFLRLYPDEWNAARLHERRQEILDDVTETTGLAFLGLTVGCAKCHDHKYDPIPQRDYFRLQAFFAAMQPVRVPLPSPAFDAWEKATADTRAKMETVAGKKRRDEGRRILGRFADDIQAAVLKAPKDRTPLEEQIAQIALKQVHIAEAAGPAKLPAEAKKQFLELEKSLPPRPERSFLLAVTDVGPVAPPTHRLVGGDWRKPSTEVPPGFPKALGGTPTIRPRKETTGRRNSALADWLADRNNPLTARVMANRVWQQMTGQGLVATSSDFGTQGTPATHPELLDWLACELIDSGWSIKHLVRLIATSSTYRQSSRVDPVEHAQALRLDRENNLLWRMRPRRMEGEAIRDAILAVSGALHRRAFGPAARPLLPANVGRGGWTPDADARDRDRRSVYVLAKRNLRYPLFDAFDQPDLCQSSARRLVTTTAPQALALLNGDLTRTHARSWAARLSKEAPSRAIEMAYQSAWGRLADGEEMRLALGFVAGQEAKGATRAEALERFCHALFNTSEFSHID